MHKPWLYKAVHKVHHESNNPDPFSGLSMRWAESTLYFSAVPLMACFFPLWMIRLLTIGLIPSPLEGHSGHGSWDSQGSDCHYIHHAKFNWNYGSSPLWDYLMGTNYLIMEKDENMIMSKEYKK